MVHPSGHGRVETWSCSVRLEFFVCNHLKVNNKTVLSKNWMVHTSNSQHIDNTAHGRKPAIIPRPNRSLSTFRMAPIRILATADAPRTAFSNIAHAAGAGHVSPGRVQRMPALDRRKRCRRRSAVPRHASVRMNLHRQTIKPRKAPRTQRQLTRFADTPERPPFHRLFPVRKEGIRPHPLAK